MQKVRGHTYVCCASTACRHLVSDLFHSPPGVLFTFPSRYLFTILSTARHEKSRRNLGGPSPNPKYSLVTDSEPVP